MSESIPKPTYTIWQAIGSALALSLRAIDEIRALARLPGPQGEKGDPGQDGKDGMGFEDLTIEHEDGGRVVVYRLALGDRLKEFRCTTDTVLDRGVFKDGDTYERGDMVTWGGSGWVCQKETRAKPGDGSSDWRLFVKKGRDGKDGINGKDGTPGLNGKDGRDRY